MRDSTGEAGIPVRKSGEDVKAPGEGLPPVLGRPSAAAGQPAALRPEGWAGRAAYRADEGQDERWALRAASLAGVRHRLAGADSEDAYAWRRAGQAIVVAVGDGVGSRSGSAAAALVAVHAGCEAASPLAGQDVPDLKVACEEAVGAANRAVRGGTGATTLVVAVAGPEGHCSLARVGDSTAMVLASGEWRALFPSPAADSVSSNATAALPADAPSIDTAECVLSPGEALVVMTDGIADPLRDGPTTVAPALAAGMVVPPAAVELLALVDFSRHGCHDDRTVVGLWRRRPEDA